MPQPTEIAALSDREVLLVLSHLTYELRLSVDTDAPAVTSASQAREALAAFLDDFASAEATAPDVIVPDDASAAAIGRGLLAHLIEDDVAGDAARALVTNPPDDAQMALPLAIGAAIVLGVLVTWLQTKVDISVAHKNGEWTFEFELHKDATDPALIKDIVDTVKVVTPG